MTLCTYPGNVRAYQAQISAKYNSGKDLKVVSDPPDFILGETNRGVDFLRKFPVGKVPVYEEGEFTLFETNAIAYYLANDQLRGGTCLKSQALIRQWIDFADNEIRPNACNWVYPCLGILHFNKQATERAKQEIKNALAILNDHLRTRTFLVTERITLADISVAMNLLELYRMVLDPTFRSPYGNVTRWFETIVNQPEVSSVVGKVTLADTMAEFDAKKFAELHPKGQQKGSKQKGQQQQKKSDKKESKKSAESSPQRGDADETGKGDEPGTEVEKKEETKDPFAVLPKGTFVMDEWKKMYSNNPAEVFNPWFFDHFDSENYSIWYCEYLYQDELTLIFMTCNLVSGMMQRLDRMRKHAFGSMVISGKDRDNQISGLWIWRGHELAFKLHADLQIDYESYKWRKLDYSQEETKDLIKSYWTQDDENYAGRAYNQGKIFK